MWMFVMEAGIALALLLLIVWWTLGPVQKRENQQQGQSKVESRTQGKTPDQES